MKAACLWPGSTVVATVFRDPGVASTNVRLAQTCAGPGPHPTPGSPPTRPGPSTQLIFLARSRPWPPGQHRNPYPLLPSPTLVRTRRCRGSRYSSGVQDSPVNLLLARVSGLPNLQGRHTPCDTRWGPWLHRGRGSSHRQPPNHGPLSSVQRALGPHRREQIGRAHA